MIPGRELHFPQFASLQRAAQIMEQARDHLDLLVSVSPAANARFASYLRETELTPAEQKPVKAIVLGAVLDSLRNCYPNESVLEEIEYQARRLAKLQVDPAVVHEALACFDEGLLEEVTRQFPDRLFVAKTIVNHYHLFVTNVINITLYQLWRADSKLLEDMSAVELSELSEKDLCARIVLLVKLWSGADAVAIHPSPGRSLPSAAGAATFAAKTGSAQPPALIAEADSELPDEVQEARWPSSLNGTIGFRMREDDPRVLTKRWLGRYRSVWSFPIHAGMRQLGVLQLAFLRGYDWLPSEEALLLQVSERLGLALTRCELVAGLSSREAQVRQLASHLQQVEERERKRISRELHDEAGQSLLYLRLQLEMLENGLSSRQKKLKEELRRCREQVETIIVEIRRLISALSPTVLEQFGLVAAIRHLLKEFLRVSQAQVELNIDLPENLERANGASMVAYRFVQEALHNILSHSKAETVKISASLDDGQLVCQVSDDGIGFRVREVQRQDHSFGLRGISERVLLMGGTVEIASEPGSGASVMARMPLTEDPAMPGLAALATVTRHAKRKAPPAGPASGATRDTSPSVTVVSGWDLVGGGPPAAQPTEASQQERGAKPEPGEAAAASSQKTTLNPRMKER
ncbi:MAG: GAF domain-containing sensor histidine kinase [Bryobacterales bacterium]|nr:GAF domain-containing sensor histidine kinase [Bryobacterales bacterium]